MYDDDKKTDRAPAVYTEQITIRVTPEQKFQLEKRAAVNKTTVSEEIRHLVDQKRQEELADMEGALFAVPRAA